MWSPDGRHLAYRKSSETCRDTVELTDPAGRPVASLPGTGWLVSWSPDSTRVATWVDLFKTIGIYGLDGVRQALLTVPLGCVPGGDFDPVWSPDGTSVLIAPCEVPVDGRTPHRLPVDDPRSRRQIAYSPDGARVAFIAAGSLVVAAADGAGPRVLISDGVEFSPAWSPTGDRIAFIASGDQTGLSGTGTSDLRIVEVASGNATRLARVSGDGPSYLLRFSPDGGRILIWQADTNDVPSLWSVNADGSDARRLVTGTDWGDWQTLPAGP
jgi:Tol biopolymer transport system component